MLRAAWPIYNVDLESVKQLSRHPLLSSGSDKITLMPCCHLSMATERTVSRTTKPCDWAFKTLPDLETNVLQDAFLCNKKRNIFFLLGGLFQGLKALKKMRRTA